MSFAIAARMMTAGILMLLSTEAIAQGSPDETVESLVADNLGIFVVLPERRDPLETARVIDGTLIINFLRPIKNEPERAVCDGARWLLVGRLDQSRGAEGVFSQDPSIQQIRLMFYDLKTTVRPTEGGRYQQTRSAIPQLILEISRTRARQLKAEVLRETLRGSRCSSLARKLLDRVELSRRVSADAP